MKRTYVIANIFWLVLAAAACIESWRYNVGSLHNPGPGFLPFYTSILLGCLALISLLQTLKAASSPASEVWGGINFGKLGLLLDTLFPTWSFSTSWAFSSPPFSCSSSFSG